MLLGVDDFRAVFDEDRPLENAFQRAHIVTPAVPDVGPLRRTRAVPTVLGAR